MREALNSAQASGADVELVSIVGKKIAPCDGCLACKKTGKCKIEDDMQEIYAKLLEADGIIFGTPVYFWNVSAQAKTIIDRTYVFIEGRRLRNKIAAVVVVARRAGATIAFTTFHHFFNNHNMISAGGALGYPDGAEIGSGKRGGGAIAYAGDTRGEVVQDTRGMSEARELGAAMVRTISRYKKGKLI